VVNVQLKGAARPRQVWAVKANASEPLKKGRKTERRCQNRGFKRGLGSSAGGDLFATGMTPGLKAARSRLGLKHGTLEPVVSPASSLSSRCKRERRKRSTREAESTNARHRGGTTRSSVERP
jgi:hypothetical protein